MLIFGNVAQEQLIERTLKALHSFTRLKLQLLDQTEIVDFLLKSLNNEKYYGLIIEILIDALNNSQVADILSTSGLSNALSLIPDSTKASVKKLIEFTAVNSSQSFLENINSHDSTFCRGIIELVTAIGIKFNIFILENNEHSHALLKLLLMCASHGNLRYSYFCFDFWTNFRTIISQIADSIVKHINSSYITEAYMEVFKILVTKCQHSKLTTKPKGSKVKGKIINVETNQEEDDEGIDDGFDNLDDDSNQMKLNEYRTHAADVFFAVHSVHKMLKGPAGIKEVYLQIFAILTQPSVTQKETQEYVNYITQCESAISAANEMVDGDTEDRDDYICEMIPIIITLPWEELLVNTVCQLLCQANVQLKYCTPATIVNVFKYILKNLMNPACSYIAAQVIKFRVLQ